MPASEEDVAKREAAVAAKEKQLKEYALVKEQWAALKTKSAGQDTRLATATKELEAKETYIRKLVKKERETAAALSAANKQLDRLQSAEERAATMEKEREEALERLRKEEARASAAEHQTAEAEASVQEKAKAADEARARTAKLAEEIAAMKQQAKVGHGA